MINYKIGNYCTRCLTDVSYVYTFKKNKFVYIIHLGFWDSRILLLSL